MTHNSRYGSLSIFRTSEGTRPRVAGEANWLRRVDPKTPGFLVRRESASSGLWSSLRVLFERVKSSPSRKSHVSLFRSAAAARSGFPGRPLGVSVLLHCSFIFVVIYLPHMLARDAHPVKPAVALRSEIIYYRVPLSDPSRMLPHIAPAGSGARPGNGSLPDASPALGSTVSRWKLTIVSRPPHPDNSRQTIYQPSSPPDLRITTEIKLPNIVLGKPSDAPKAPLNPSAAKPTQATRQSPTEEAPSPAPSSPAATWMTVLEPSITQPHLLLPSASTAAPTRNPASSTPASGAADSGDSTALLAIGIDPSLPTPELAFPPGNRWGEFSVSPAGGWPGSPGGNPDAAYGGNVGRGAGGDISTGVGPGREGGGGSVTTSIENLSISGTGKTAEGSGSLGPGFAAGMVYAVPTAVLPRRNSLVVSAGPVGGGGLEVYRALHCGKIYTVFLAMPAKNWTLQYCEQAKPGETATEATAPNGPSSTVIHLQPGIVPPDAESRFDFRRLPVPPEKAGKMIVLKGTLLEDGTVNDLKIYQGILPEMDEAARLAFGRWKFKPAMREGKPLALQILVGIPMTASVVQ
jgi:hypothetical protein